jgi:hypothetical protein
MVETIKPVLTPLDIDPTDERVFLITDKGLTVISVSSVPLSIGTVTPSSGAPGTVITVRGSGYQSGMTATVNGTPAVVLVLDPQTAQITFPRETAD